MHIDRNEAIKQIRENLKRRSGKTWSVTGDRGTAYGWLKVDVPPKQRTWRHTQTKTQNGVLPVPPVPGAIYLGCDQTPSYYVDDGTITSYENDAWAQEAVRSGREVIFRWEYEDVMYEFGHMSPSARKELGELFGQRSVHHQGLSISPDSREYYVERSAGVTNNVEPERSYD